MKNRHFYTLIERKATFVYFFNNYAQNYNLFHNLFQRNNTDITRRIYKNILLVTNNKTNYVLYNVDYNVCIVKAVQYMQA